MGPDSLLFGVARPRSGFLQPTRGLGVGNALFQQLGHGLTQKVEPEDVLGNTEFLETHVASLTVLSGPAAGLEFPLDSPRVIAGRSDRARIRLAFDSISSEHAGTTSS